MMAAMRPCCQVAIGCRKLFAPRLLGQDPELAKEHLLIGAAAMPADERPYVFAALAVYTLGDVAESRELLHKALERTPANPIARAALRRIEAGEEAAFRRDAP